MATLVSFCKTAISEILSKTEFRGTATFIRGPDPGAHFTVATHGHDGFSSDGHGFLVNHRPEGVAKTPYRPKRDDEK